MREDILDCTARLVANRVAHKLKVDELDGMVERLRTATGGPGKAGPSPRGSWS